MKVNFEQKIGIIETKDREREEDMRVLKDAHTRMMKAVMESRAMLESGH